MVVLAAPLVLVAVWASLRRPDEAPLVSESLGHLMLTEGQATTRRVEVTDGEGRVETVAVAFDPSELVDQRPDHGYLVSGPGPLGAVTLELSIRPVRWGSHRLKPVLVVMASALNGFRYVSEDWEAAGDVTAFPYTTGFDAAAPDVHTPGLAGVNRSPRPGSGNEFATVRPFQPGDRLRRIHWVESLRSGSLHLTSTWADQDRNVVLVIDAFQDVGISGGVDGSESSLDVSVRAAAAIAEHYVRVGDRVAVVPIGAGLVHRLAPNSGRAHLRRILEVLVRVESAGSLIDSGRMPRGLSPGALVIVLSPLLTPAAQQRLMTIADHGFSVLAIDCLPPDSGAGDDPLMDISWRLAALERESRLRQVRAAGVPVVPWHGPGSLDAVLRGLHRRSGGRVMQR